MMKKILALFLCVVLLPFGEAEGKAFEKELTQDGVKGELRTEIPEYRTRNSDTYVLPDGSFETVVYSEDKYYEDDYVELKEIDDTIIPVNYERNNVEYHFTNSADSTRVFFADGKSVETLVIADGAEISFQMQNPDGKSPVVTTDYTEDAISGFNLCGNNYIKYMNVREATDIIYSVHHDALKEFIVLHDSSAEGEFIFNVSYAGCQVCVDAEGNVGFVDLTAGREMFQLGRLFAVDSNGAYCDSFSYNVKEVSANRIIVSFTIPVSFLQSEERAFPVLIDPTILVSGSSSTYDTCIDQQYPTSNYYLSTNLWTGGLYGSNAMRTLLKFDLPTTISGSQLTRATLRVQKREYQVPTIRAHRISSAWSSSTATWNNQPSYAPYFYSPQCIADGGDWYKMDVTEIVYSWLSGTYNNYGFLLKEIDESSSSQKTKFYSSDSDYPHRPELILHYVNFMGTRAGDLTEREDINGMGYALEYEAYVLGTDLIGSNSALVGMTKQQVLNYVAAQAEVWMDTYLGSSNYVSIAAYDSDIYSVASPGWYRAVMRIGILGDFDGTYAA